MRQRKGERESDAVCLPLTFPLQIDLSSEASSSLSNHLSLPRDILLGSPPDVYEWRLSATLDSADSAATTIDVRQLITVPVRERKRVEERMREKEKREKEEESTLLTLLFFFKQSNSLVAVIEPASRMVSYLSDFSLDASQSADPDLPAQISYTLTVRQIEQQSRQRERPRDRKVENYAECLMSRSL
jgi:hypothetical protein